ncbi:MAG: transporter substrate-binding domain-containing protein [Leptolyngbyaceae bacterium]|nr:transporter substrate-binding domain-containing protein [Leptolyngbyaceae bacterium]
MSRAFKKALSRFSSLCLVMGLTGAQLAIYSQQQSGSAAELIEIQRRGYLIVAVKDNVRPLGFRNASGQLVGLEIDIARRLAQELLGRPDAVQLQPVSNQERLPAVLQEKSDLAIARVTATPARSRLVSFSSPYYLDGTALVTQAAKIQRLSDLTNQPIAVLKGSTTIATVRYFLPNATLIGVDSYEAGRQLLESGKAIAFAGDASVLSGWVQEFSRYRLLPTLLSTEPLSIVMPKGLQYDDLRRQVNAAIARWQQEGWLRQRANYWGLPWAPTVETSMPTSPPLPVQSTPNPGI